MKAFLAVLALAAPLAAHAQWPKAVEARLTRDFDRCMKSGDAARGQTLAMFECNSAEIERQDQRLNQAYRMVMGRLSAPRKTRLRQSERAWITGRDRDCKAAARQAGGGTASGLEYQGCFLRATIERTIWLERYR